MVEAFMTLVIVIMLLLAVCFIGSLVLAKDTKEFHIHFVVLKGFDISGIFLTIIIHKKIDSRRVVEEYRDGILKWSYGAVFVFTNKIFISQELHTFLDSFS